MDESGIKRQSKVLKNGTDYTVSYSNNTKVGTATVKITGKGNEMIRCIRGMKMDNDQLYDLLDGIQSGTVKFQVSRESDEEGSGSFVFTEENKEEIKMTNLKEVEKIAEKFENNVDLVAKELKRTYAG